MTTKILCSIVFIAALSSCSNTKSNDVQINTQASANPTTSTTINSQKLLTSCNKSENSDMSFHINAVVNTSGQINPDWIKIKYNFLSATNAVSGNTVKFFKWKVSGGQSVLDQTPLSVMFYDLSSNQLTSNPGTSLVASEISLSRGIYIQLNDVAGTFQVIKAVVYNSSGQIVAQLNSLIPQFNSNPAEYATNSDGSARAQILIDMHPLKSVATTAWTQTDFTNFFQSYCF